MCVWMGEYAHVKEDQKIWANIWSFWITVYVSYIQKGKWWDDCTFCTVFHHWVRLTLEGVLDHPCQKSNRQALLNTVLYRRRSAVKDCAPRENCTKATGRTTGGQDPAGSLLQKPWLYFLFIDVFDLRLGLCCLGFNCTKQRLRFYWNSHDYKQKEFAGFIIGSTVM